MYALYFNNFCDQAGIALCSEGTQDENIHWIFLSSLPQQPAIEKMSSLVIKQKNTIWKIVLSNITYIVRCVATGQNKFLCLMYYVYLWGIGTEPLVGQIDL